MEGWFFYVEGTRNRLRTWDIALGSLPAEVPFDKVADVAPVIVAAHAGDVDQLRELVSGRPKDDPFVRVALEVAVDEGAAAAAATIVEHAKLSRRISVAALCEAATNRRPEVARALLDAGVPAASHAIWPAVWSGSADVLEQLLARGADVRKSGQSLASMLEYSERQNHPSVTKILRKLA